MAGNRREGSPRRQRGREGREEPVPVPLPVLVPVLVQLLSQLQAPVPLSGLVPVPVSVPVLVSVPVPVPVPMPVLVPAPEHRGGSGPGSPPPARPVAASPERARRQLPRSARPARGCAPPAGPAGTPPSPLASLHAPRISPVGPPPGRAGQGLRAGGGGASCPRGGRVPAALVLSLSQSRRYFSSGPAAGLCPAPPWAPRSSSPACSPRSALG